MASGEEMRVHNVIGGNKKDGDLPSFYLYVGIGVSPYTFTPDSTGKA